MATTVLDELITIFGFKANTKDLDKINQKIKNIQGSINKVAKGFAIAGAALTGVGVAVVKASLSYEEAINDLRVFTDLTEDSIDKLKDQARELGKGGRFGAKEVLAGQRALFQGQFSVNEVLKQMPHIVNSATASLVPLDQRAQEVVTILKQWKLEASDTQDVTDLLGAASKQAGFDIKVLPRTLGTIAPLAHQVGLSLQGAITEIVTLGEQAGGGSRGFQSAASAIEILLRELTELEEGSPGYLLLRQLQIDPSEIGKSVQLKDIFESLKGASDDVLREVFGPEYISDVLLRTSPEAIARAEQLQDVLSDVMGTAKEMSDERNMGLPGAWADFTSALTDVQIALGESGVSKAAGWLLSKLRDLLWVISSAPGPVKAFAGAVIIAGPILLGAAAAAKILAWSLDSSLVRAIGRLARAIYTTFVPSLVRAKIHMIVTSGAARGMWAAITGPIGLVIAAFALLGFVVYKFRRQILGALKAVWSWIKGNWPLLLGILLGPFGIVGALIYKFRRQILGALKAVWNWAKGNWPLLVGILFGPFGIAAGLIFKFRDDVVGAIMWIKDKIMAIFTSLRDFVIGIWQGLGAAIGGAFRGVINAVISGLNKALDAAASFVEAIKGVLDKVPFGNPLGDFLLGVASKLRAGIPNFAIGGIVPGPLGRPLLATVHGGEMVLPVGAARVIAQMLEGFRLGPAALPQAPYHYGQMYRSLVVNKSVTVHIHEPIVIHTEATDAKGIAQELGEAIQDQIRNVAYDHDGPVER